MCRTQARVWDLIVSGAGDYTITDASKVLVRAGVKTGPRLLPTSCADSAGSTRISAANGWPISSV